MNIIEATKKSAETNKAIYQKSDPQILFVPTNSCSVAFIMIDRNSDLSGKLWNPNIDDVVANDWELEQ